MSRHSGHALFVMLGVWLATSHPLPAPVTVLPEASPKPNATPRPKAASPTPKPVPLKTTNAHGVPDGNYHFPTENKKAEHGASQVSNYFVVHGTTFDWFRTSRLDFNDEGHRAGKRDYSYTVKMSGSIARKSNGTLNFKPGTAVIVARSPKSLKDSETQIADLRAQTRAAGWTLTYASGRIREPSSGSVWSFRD